MKAKQISALIVGVLIVSDVSAQEELKTIPSIERVKYITLETSPTLWEGSFHTNGAARIVWRGNGATDYVAAASPKGSFSFENIYSTLVPRLEQAGSTNRDMRVVLYGRDYESSFMRQIRGTRPGPDDFTYTGYLRHTRENKKVVRELMSSVRDQSVPREKETFEAMLRDYPLVTGDKPVARVYRKDLHDAASRAALEDAFWEGRRGDTEVWTKKILATIQMPDNLSPEEQEAHIRRREKYLWEAWGLPLSPEEEERAIAIRLAEWRAVCNFLNPPPAKLIAGEVTIETGQEEDGAQAPSRSWLYVAILSALCAGVVLWLIRRKR